LFNRLAALANEISRATPAAARELAARPALPGIFLAAKLASVRRPAPPRPWPPG